MRKLHRTIRNNKGMTTSLLSGIAFLALLVLAACLHTKSVSLDLFGAGIAAAGVALGFGIASSHKAGNDWCKSHHIAGWQWW